MQDYQNGEILDVKLTRFKAVRFERSAFYGPAELERVWECFKPTEESVLEGPLVLLKTVFSKITLGEVPCAKSAAVSSNESQGDIFKLTYQGCMISQHRLKTNSPMQLHLQNQEQILAKHLPISNQSPLVFHVPH